jgi:NADH-quinone oxidoreductase subunit J
VAALYLALQAEFIAVVQVLLYVGAIMTLIIFAIMLTHRIGDQTIPQKNKQSLPAFFVLSAFVGLVSGLILKADWPTAQASARVDALALGQALLGPYVFPFEIISVVLIAGLIGAVVIARKD